CTVETKEVVILPNPPADDGSTKFQLVMEDGISKVPAGLQNIEALNTPEKLETAMKTAITQANSGVPQANTAVYDVELQISTDGGTTWTKATAGNFPANGLTITLPYPAGTNSSYTFTMVHMFTTSDFGKTPGDIETPRVINTASGLQFTVTGLSPVSVGWTAPATTPDTPSGGNHGGGGGGSVSTYAVTVEKSEHGKVTSNRTNASNGSTVTLTITPDSGYVLDALTVTDSRGNEIKLTAQGGNKYTFTMPSRAVTVKASFVPLPDDTQKPCDGGADCPSRGFSDLGSVGTWYHEAVDYVLRNDLMGGYGNGLFGPNDNLSRAQFAQILFNKEGRPVVNYLLQYGDVAEGAWYTEAIRWATSRGIVGGYGNGMFGPNDNITREQLAVMLWRYAGSPAATDKELHFTDADQASGFALDALRWAVENGIINGYGDGLLGPQGQATRAQVAQMLKNFIENREPDA
ncbi:S-layer homology domain-containing protein, partial [Pseudoflavonifractor sp. 60]|uniref:S-layer homology domain-containing protein n=1 Tax=Pseudoflavonifractor sp. 60 TaxID=2304576 RepID=UPI001A9B8F01